jgi:prevent-host-death family protein
MSHIIPSAELRNHYPEVSSLAKEAQEPIFITVNGKGDCVLLSLEQYDELQGKLDLLLLMSQAQNDIDQGHLSKADPFFAELRKKYSLEGK